MTEYVCLWGVNLVDAGQKPRPAHPRDHRVLRGARYALLCTCFALCDSSWGGGGTRCGVSFPEHGQLYRWCCCLGVGTAWADAWGAAGMLYVSLGTDATAAYVEFVQSDNVWLPDRSDLHLQEVLESLKVSLGTRDTKSSPALGSNKRISVAGAVKGLLVILQIFQEYSILTTSLCIAGGAGVAEGVSGHQRHQIQCSAWQ